MAACSSLTLFALETRSAKTRERFLVAHTPLVAVGRAPSHRAIGASVVVIASAFPVDAFANAMAV